MLDNKKTQPESTPESANWDTDAQYLKPGHSRASASKWIGLGAAGMSAGALLGFLCIVAYATLSHSDCPRPLFFAEGRGGGWVSRMPEQDAFGTLGYFDRQENMCVVIFAKKGLTSDQLKPDATCNNAMFLIGTEFEQVIPRANNTLIVIDPKGVRQRFQIRPGQCREWLEDSILRSCLRDEAQPKSLLDAMIQCTQSSIVGLEKLAATLPHHATTTEGD